MVPPVLLTTVYKITDDRLVTEDRTYRSKDASEKQDSLRVKCVTFVPFCTCGSLEKTFLPAAYNGRLQVGYP